ncbi:hypothetical protein [Streptomyces sp. NRRL F-5122]|uniref:hypothetical protein n=1 Tax=Streptomyces sp. NRRL F-5122 TaxID=1609098 RepID=UPI001F309C87|nr:hypothetical protein [Streptomyces sp. NRRL F-5122]
MRGGGPVLDLAGWGCCIRAAGHAGGGGEELWEACARLGVAPRSEGWGLWNTWGEGDLEVTLVVSAVETTVGLLESWSRGRGVDPVLPLPSQNPVIRHGWIGPMTLAPRAGLGGRTLS